MNAAKSSNRAALARLQELFEQRKAEVAALSPFVGKGQAENIWAQFTLYAMKTPAILEATPVSLLAGLMRVAQTGLELGTTCYLVPFKSRKPGGVTTASFVADYRGLIELAATGRVRAVNAGVVRKGDRFEWELGSHPFARHQPLFNSNAPVEYAWASAQIGYTQAVVVVLDRQALESRKAEYANPDVRKESLDDVAWWCRKTAIRDLCNLLPKSPRLALALCYDDAVEDGEAEVVSSVVTPPPARVERPLLTEGPMQPVEVPRQAEVASNRITEEVERMVHGRAAHAVASDSIEAWAQAFVMPIGYNKDKRLGDLPTGELEGFIAWSEAQGSLGPKATEAVRACAVVLQARKAQGATVSSSFLEKHPGLEESEDDGLPF